MIIHPQASVIFHDQRDPNAKSHMGKPPPKSSKIVQHVRGMSTISFIEVVIRGSSDRCHRHRIASFSEA